MHGNRPTTSPLDQPIVQDTWREKYAYQQKHHWPDTCRRVANALDGGDVSFCDEIYRAMLAREIVPAGRILAGAGTDKRVTLINCFVSPTVQDSMRTESGLPGKGIMDALCDGSYTQQMGGGIGTDFSTIRPRGAVVRRTNSVSSGVLPFMDMWDAMCATIRSSGSRRGAMMGTLGIWHPDIEEFIEAKQQRGRLTNFNVSVLVPDAFMRAVERDESWELTFPVPREGQDPACDRYWPHYQKESWWARMAQDRGPGCTYLYRKVRARDLWDQIIQATYVYAEPGVIFIDRINQMNNLAYCEHIHCVNPCGEQCLPDNGACNLGHTNLAVMVDRPFEPDVAFNFDKLERATKIMVRLLDNVLDVTLWPTEEQRLEGTNKRRIGLGFTGLATALQQLGIPYGSEEAVEFTREVARRQAHAAYEASAKLARERGSFPLYDKDKLLAAPFIKKLSPLVREEIEKWGLRNGVLLSVAPTGTTSLVMGNVSSGIEPVFAHRYRRKVRGDSGEMSNEYSVYDYGYLEYCNKEGIDPEARYERVWETPLPDGFVTADQLTVEQHLLMAAAAQEWVDSAISKTINCPTSMGIDEFRAVYTRAYELGMKGCTTYRPDPRSGRGAVLEVAESSQPAQQVPASDAAQANAGGDHEDVTPDPDKRNALGRENALSGMAPPPADKIPMQAVAEGRRYQIKWPGEDCAYYIHIYDTEVRGRRRPFELFISTKSERHSEWVKAFALLVTAILRREADPTFVVDELKSVFAAQGGTWVRVPWQAKPKLATSLVATIGLKLEEHMRELGLIEPDEALVAPGHTDLMVSPEAIDEVIGAGDELMSLADIADVCAHCGAKAVIYAEGCATCHACGKSDCG